MPIAILKFKLPEEQNEFDQARMSPKYVSALGDYYQWIRSKHKHGGGTHGDPQRAYDEAFDEFMRICRENGFDPLTGLP